MAKKPVKKGIPKRAAKKAATESVAPLAVRRGEFLSEITSQPRDGVSHKEKVKMPLYACLDNGPGAKCTLMQYNPRTHQYDIDMGDIDCNLCTHIIQPTQ